MKKFLIILTFISSLLLFSGLLNELIAQCPMCKLAAESNLKDGGSAGKGLNQGILYMFAMPYLIIVLMGFIWYKNRLKEDEEEVYLHN